MKTERGWIYVLDNGMGHFKIGWAYDLDRRVKYLKIQLPFPVRVAYAFETENPRQVERMLHQQFADKRLNGEWFALNDNPYAGDEYDFAVITSIANHSGRFENINGTWHQDCILEDIACHQNEAWERLIVESFDEGLINQEEVDYARLHRDSKTAPLSRMRPTLRGFFSALNQELRENSASSSEAIH